MAVRLVTNTKHYVWAPGDDRPRLGVQQDGTTLTVADLPVNSVGFEEGTGRVYRWDGVGSWVELTTPRDPRLDSLATISDHLAAMRRLLAAGFALQDDSN